MDGAGNRPYVFISYASADRPRVTPIASALRERDVGVWLDTESIPGGTIYGPEIVDGIAGCSALVLMCSASSLASPNVRQEIALAWKYHRPYLPLLLEPVEIPREVEYWLEGAQWIEILDHPPEMWLPKLERALNRVAVQAPSEARQASQIEPPPFSPPAVRLPTPAQPLVGREAEREEIVRRVRESRLVTLVGPGGTGKTRLAVQVATDLASTFIDGASFVDLAPVSEPDRVLPAIAAVLNVDEIAGQPIRQALMDYLQTKHLLLVLDNVEHVIQAATGVAGLLDACPQLHVLATSRSPLRIAAEQEFFVPPLETPDLDRLPVVDQLAGIDSVRLFTERAQAIKAEFSLTEGNARAVAEICSRLDGLPLAIELAASRIRVLTPDAMLERFDRWLPALTGGSRDRPERHQTLRNTIAWSYDLLGDEEQQIFRALSVFRGGWTLDGAAEVTATDTLAVLDGLDALATHSFVRMIEREGGEPRYSMLETVREFGQEQLDAAGELDERRWKHAEHTIRMVEQVAEDLYGPRQVEMLEQLDDERANIQIALDWLIGRNAAEQAMRLIAPLWIFYWMRGYLNEGREQFERVLALPHDSVPADLRAATLTGAGVATEWTGDFDAAEALQREAISLWESLPESHWPALHWSHACLGNIAVRRGALDEASERYQAVIDIGERQNEDGICSSGWLSLGIVSQHRGDFGEAERRYSRALDYARRTGEPWGISLSAANLADISLELGDYSRGSALLSEAAEISRRLNHRWQLLWTEMSLGWSALYQQRADEAFHHFGAAIDQARDLGRVAMVDTGGPAYYGLGEGHLLRRDLPAARAAFQSALYWCEQAAALSFTAGLLVGIAGLLIDEHRFRDAARCLGMADGLRASAGVSTGGYDAATFEQRVETARLHLTSSAFEEAYGSDQARTEGFEEAMTTAARMLG